MKPITIIAICAICAATLMSGCMEPAPEEKQAERQTYQVNVSYQSPMYKTVTHSDPVYETVTHNDPIYKTVRHSDPVYGMVTHREPVYETLLSMELRDAAWSGDEVYRYYNVYDFDRRYTGRDTWGNAEYTFTVYYYGADGNKYHGTSYQIDEWDSSTSEVLTGYRTWTEKEITDYNTWTEKEITDYNTWTEEVLTGYNTWTEEVLTGYETLNRVETRYCDESYDNGR